MTDTKWVKIARAELGTAEKAGKIHNDRILEYFEISGHPEIKNDETAWCSAFTNFCMEKAGIKGTMSLAARSWLRWGKKVKPVPGCILIFSRGSSSWQGHVTFLLEETKTHFKCIGGNQANRVSIKLYPKARLLGARWPSTMKNSGTVKAAAAGALGSTASFAIEQAQEARLIAEQASSYWEWASYAAIGLAVIGIGLTVWFRWRDMKEKGR